MPYSQTLWQATPLDFRQDRIGDEREVVQFAKEMCLIGRDTIYELDYFRVVAVASRHQIIVFLIPREPEVSEPHLQP